MAEQGLGIQRGKPSSFSRAGSMDFVWLTVGRANFHDVASGSGIAVAAKATKLRFFWKAF